MNDGIVPGFGDGKHDDDTLPGFNNGLDSSVKLSLERILAEERGLIVHVDGCIVGDNLLFCSKQIEKIFESGFHRIVFEMSRLTYFDDIGDAIFKVSWKLATAHNSMIVFQGIQPKVYEALQLLGYPQHLTFTNNLAESIAHLSQASLPEDAAAGPKPLLKRRKTMDKFRQFLGTFVSRDSERE